MSSRIELGTLLDNKQLLENRQKFLDRLSSLPAEQIQLIDFAYDITKEAHRSQNRDSGERYFEHPRNVTLILMDELKILDPNMVIAEEFHDTGEDTPIFGNITKGYYQWVKTATFRISKIANYQVAEYVIGLTKPKVDNIDFFSKEEVNEFYLNRFKNLAPEIILLKMCDRLHNLRSLSGTTHEKQIKTCKETIEKYFPIFELIKEKYPDQHQYLIGQMKQEITKFI